MNEIYVHEKPRCGGKKGACQPVPGFRMLRKDGNQGIRVAPSHRLH